MMNNLDNLEGCKIIAADGQYLGTITWNIVDPASIGNVVGAYGSVVSPTSIWNVVGSYGSVLGPLSAFNEIASNPPSIVAPNGNFIAYLTKNVMKTPRIDPDSLRSD